MMEKNDKAKCIIETDKDAIAKNNFFNLLAQAIVKYQSQNQQEKGAA